MKIQNLHEARTPKPVGRFDPKMLDGIDYIDSSSIDIYMKQLVSRSAKERTSPYYPIRQLVHYFDEETGARKTGGTAVKELINYMLNDKDISKAIYNITTAHKALIDIIYGGNIYGKEQLHGKDLAVEAGYKIDDIMTNLGTLMVAMDRGQYKTFFADHKAFTGTSDKKQLGLSTILFRAWDKADEIKKAIEKLVKLANKPSDPMSYSQYTGKKVRESVNMNYMTKDMALNLINESLIDQDSKFRREIQALLKTDDAIEILQKAYDMSDDNAKMALMDATEKQFLDKFAADEGSGSDESKDDDNDDDFDDTAEPSEENTEDLGFEADGSDISLDGSDGNVEDDSGSNEDAFAQLGDDLFSDTGDTSSDNANNGDIFSSGDQTGDLTAGADTSSNPFESRTTSFKDSLNESRRLARMRKLKRNKR